ncbi:hypothetical protein DID88_000129 [Monilinia fructigena]|uniref:diphthine methyl ester synthase n=1 Tax=Monilinia fructigena TaxID=38457 RepID=A0A395ILV4_9HELO|nr:hypothetical protein DID88_000129 [Monilinia fructigena]
MLYLIGLGLSDETDITVKGLEAVKKCSRVYLEAYTSILLVDKSVLESYYGREVIIADRDMVESASDDILENAQNVDVAFLVVGDPFGATTHTDLVLRARSLNIPISTIPNAPLCLPLCAAQMLEIEEARTANGEGGVYNEESLCVGAARVGCKDEKFVSGTLKQLCDADEQLGGPLHSLVLLGRRTHELEHDYVREFAVDKEVWDTIWKRDYEGRVIMRIFKNPERSNGTTHRKARSEEYKWS